MKAQITLAVMTGVKEMKLQLKPAEEHKSSAVTEDSQWCR